ncbi:probable LRR receptor-like serine/threonine-protein kinase At2g16250 [Coffea eugenioides]|uniref:probable LRR receptor-like serine/threonine-protein kinase At2g16250 n=1 Tax=Coffea eugenioides TaxID=49369 RepID=UPI000F60F5DA|nr:probable LRR receptor-like serine/threonine-protein kinase At2g16250 [Coffea eugenioides]
MTRVYDNWDRLVGATLLREELRLIAQRTPSDISSASPSPSSTSSSSSSLARKSFTYGQILQATHNLSSSNLIMAGLTGDLYTGVLEGRIRVVVKKVHSSFTKEDFYLKQELLFYSKVTHPRFVPLLGHCLENEMHKFLVYKFMPRMDLYSFWFKKAVQSHNDDCLDWLSWDKRLKIARGVAEGLDYLHHKCDPPLVHRNIDAGGILLDDNFEARLGRLNQVCTEVKETNRNKVARFLQLTKDSEKRSPGTSEATCAFDVFCFGKLLLELVTGKLNFRPPNFPIMKDDTMANTLSYITSLDKKLIGNIVDRSLIIDEELLMEVWAIAFVAKACLDPKPSKRPELSFILEALHNPMTVVTSNFLRWPSRRKGKNTQKTEGR